MALILKNNSLEIHIDPPFENYTSSRFDWTGKIVEAKFQGISLTGVERADHRNGNDFGRGFYNEFGIDSALGFEEADNGGWFHKIGVGLLKKEGDAPYVFSKNYKVDPAEFDIRTEPDKIIISCESGHVNGYAYVLTKTFELHESSLTIHYHLENRGEKDIRTTEYTHNFIAINKDLIGRNYTLEFPFQLKPELFEETVNPDGIVELGTNEIAFSGSPHQQFFFSNLNGSEKVDARWTLTNLANNLALSEHGSFKTNKVNLWGWKHVVSPELFFKIFLKSGESTAWYRKYHVHKTDQKVR